MVQSLDDIRARIQIARQGFITSIEMWVNEQTMEDFPQEARKKWLAAIRLEKGQDVYDCLRRTGFPMERTEEKVLVPSSDDSQNSTALVLHSTCMESVQYISYPQYIENATESNTFVLLPRICQLTTIIEQLLQLGELLNPVVIPTDFDALEAVAEKAHHIFEEWKWIPTDSSDIVDEYTPRVKMVNYQLGTAHLLFCSNFASAEKELDLRGLEFSVKLKFLGLCVTNLYSDVADKTTWWGTWFGYSSSWHVALRVLASILFSPDGVEVKNKNSLIIQDRFVRELPQLVEKLMNAPLKRAIDEEAKAFSQAQAHVLVAENCLNTMVSRLALSEERLSEATRRVARGVGYDTALLSILSFYNRVPTSPSAYAGPPNNSLK